MNKIYLFKSVKEIADWFRNHRGGELPFTVDTIEDIKIYGEPTGWYGIKELDTFDGYSLAFGMYGGGIIDVVNTYNEGCSFEEAICKFLNCEFDFGGSENTYAEDDLLCVDKEDWDI